MVTNHFWILMLSSYHILFFLPVCTTNLECAFLHFWGGLAISNYFQSLIQIWLLTFMFVFDDWFLCCIIFPTLLMLKYKKYNINRLINMVMVWNWWILYNALCCWYMDDFPGLFKPQYHPCSQVLILSLFKFGKTSNKFLAA